MRLDQVGVMGRVVIWQQEDWNGVVVVLGSPVLARRPQGDPGQLPTWNDEPAFDHLSYGRTGTS